MADPLFLAPTYGWSVRDVQKCPSCGVSAPYFWDDGGPVSCEDCGCLNWEACPHDGTSGLIDCPLCGVSADEFAASAGEYMENQAYA